MKIEIHLQGLITIHNSKIQVKEILQNAQK